MLTDFDLSKQSNPPCPPNIVKSHSPHVVSGGDDDPHLGYDDTG